MSVSDMRALSIEQMGKLAEMSEKNDRSEIAKELNVVKSTIWRYQKMLKLL